MNFVPDYDIDNLNPADYNPRKIAEGAFEKLKESLTKFGVCKAVILNGNGTLVAGHQRTKAMKAVGIKKVPVFLLDKRVAIHDEIRFNLMHNSIETETTKTKIANAKEMPLGFSLVKCCNIETVQKGKGIVVKEICKLMTKYGDWGSIVIDEYGNVIHNSDYAYSCSLLKRDVIAYKMTNEQAREFLVYMGIDYGSYNYETLGIKPYVQTHCQMNKNTTTIHSTLYENFVIPAMKKEYRLADFGAGKKGYVNALRNAGYKTFAYEPHLKKANSEAMDIKQVVLDIMTMEADIKKNGLYDVVVLDSVINSITSNDFEHWVLTSCNSLLASDGTFYTGTRNIDWIQKDRQKATDGMRYIEFLDKDNFSATFRKGVWTLQKFHDANSLRELLSRYFDEVKVVDTKKSQIWAICKKPKQLPQDVYLEALNIEFNMEYPGGYHHNKQAGIVNEILKHHELTL